MFAQFTRSTVRALDWLTERILALDSQAPHLKTGRRGEEDAYFYLRSLGYVMVARNFRSPRRRGEIDLIGWDGDVLCFVEVKTRTSHHVKPAEAAVNRQKQRDLGFVAQEYLRQLRETPQWRFDVVSVYYEEQPSQPRFELFKNSCSMS